MKYKGYVGHVHYDEDAKLFHGEVLGLRDVVTFQGTSVKELETAFKESVDDYLDFCKQKGREPEKPLSGKLLRKRQISLSFSSRLAMMDFKKMGLFDTYIGIVVLLFSSLMR